MVRRLGSPPHMHLTISMPSSHTADLNTTNYFEGVIVERCFGQLVQRRFPLIAGRMRLQLDNIPPTVVACMILHNCAKFTRDTGNFGQFLVGGNPAVFTTNATVN